MLLKDLEKAFGHKLIGTSLMKKMVVKVSYLPNEILDFIVRTTWIVSSFEDGWAFTLRGDEIKKGEYLIFLADELMTADEDQIIWTIIHEIGHVYLGHRNSVGEIQTRTEINRQEREADDFARKYFSF